MPVLETNEGAVPAFEILTSETPQKTGLVLDSPHSGSVYPDCFLKASRLDRVQIRSSEDAFVDALLLKSVQRGLPLLRANFPRAYLDVNREAYELDPQMFCVPLPDFVNTTSPRVKHGIGTIARTVSNGQLIYRAPLDIEEAFGRIEDFYFPYHQMLLELLEHTHRTFGYTVLLDAHSMPSHVLTSARGMARYDIIIGDLYGHSAKSGLSRAFLLILEELGFRVGYNTFYPGGYITQHYGRPHHERHALQIEINRALYMDEKRLERTRGFQSLDEALTKAVGCFCEHLDFHYPKKEFREAAE